MWPAVYVWWNAHPDVVAQNNVDLFKISLPAAQAAAKRAPAAYVPIDSTFVSAQQAEADVFEQLGVITQHVDAKKLFDTRYNKLIAGVSAAKEG